MMDGALAEEFEAMAHYLRHGPLTGGDVFEAERQRLRDEISRTGQWARDLSDRLANSDLSRQGLEGRLQQALEGLQESRGLAEERQQQVLAHRRKIDHLVDEKAELDQHLVDLAEELRNVSGTLEDVSSRLEVSSLELAVSTGKLTESQHEVQTLRDELDWIQRSTTWTWRRRVLRLLGQG